MKDRIVRIINEVGMNTTQFAEALGVQASTVQHIRSERNKPSLDVIQRLLKRFRWVNPNWLLFGEGEMRLDVTSDNLFTPDEVRYAADAETTPRKQQSSSPAHPKQTPPVQPKQTPPPPVQPLQKHRTPTVVKSQTASTHIDPTAADSSAPPPPPPTTPTHTTSTTASQAPDNPAPYPTPYICNTTKERKIDRILLLYSDSTFETFLQNVHL